MYAPRPWAHLRAILGGYFWKQCPRCGRWFAGYETRGSIPAPGRSDFLLTCCPPDVIPMPVPSKPDPALPNEAGKLPRQETGES